MQQPTSTPPSTEPGDLELRIRRRGGSFFPALLEPRRRVDQAWLAVILTAYITGTLDPQGVTERQSSGRG